MHPCRRPIEVPNKADPGHVITVPCGQCMPCRSRQKHGYIGQVRAHDLDFRESVALTLTYADAPPALNARHLHNFRKALRRWCHQHGVEISISVSLGEHGGVTDRVHWHVLVHGLYLPHGLGHYPWWPHGHVFVDTLTSEAVGYVVGYLDGSHGKDIDPRRVRRMGAHIGKNVAEQMGQIFARRHGFAWYPPTFSVGGTRYPLRRCMRQWAIEAGEALGFPRLPAPSSAELDWRGFVDRVKRLNAPVDVSAWADYPVQVMHKPGYL